MDLRESIKNIVTGNSELNQDFITCLTEHLAKSQLFTEDEAVDNTPANIPGNDLNIKEENNSGDQATEGEDKDPELDLNLDGEEPVEEGLVGGIVGGAAGAYLGGLPGVALGYAVGSDLTDSD